MRKFLRMPPPASWNPNEAKWNQQWVDLLKKTPNASFSWYVHEGKTARELGLPFLKSQTMEHCSFCDGFPVDGVSPDTIEHFRPKCGGRFPQHAYSWHNLYYCCARCQVHKGEQWDDGLIAPDEDGYTFQQFFEFDFTTGELRVSSGAGETEKLRARITIEIYGLDTSTRRRCRLLAQRMWSKHSPEDRRVDEFAYRDFVATE